MDILRRIGLYLVGLAIGIVIVAYIFKEKETEFCYSPNCRVLKNIRNKKIVYTAKAQKSLEEHAIDTTNINISVFTKGDVLFPKSNTKLDSCKTYAIEGVLNSGKVEVRVENCDSIAKVAFLIPLG